VAIETPVAIKGHSFVSTTFFLHFGLEMTKRDIMGPKVFLESKPLLHALCAMLDLRLGIRYRFPPTLLKSSKSSTNTHRSNEEVADDLDALLRDEGSTTREKNKTLKAEGNNTTFPAVIPYLTEEEFRILSMTLELLQTLIISGLEEEPKSPASFYVCCTYIASPMPSPRGSFYSFGCCGSYPTR
jgi:hypothetical protein